MIEAIQPPIGISEEEASAPALQNFAVARCRDAWERAYQATAAKGKTLCSAHEDAAKAYRRAMPPLSGHQNICDFIACAGYGILLGAIRESSATKLLYAAQIALGAVSQQSKTRGRGV